jgi:hypothetical protein
MKKYRNISLLLLPFLFARLSAQTTPIDFNRQDCNGVQRHLFADLDSGKAVIIEFFMINCAPCPAAGIKLEAMKANLLSQYPGKVISYAIAYNNTYTQAQVKNWVNSNGFSMIPMDSGATQVAYYGGMGMPTVVVLAGKATHSVIGSPYIGFNTNDTTQVAAGIRAYLNSTGTSIAENSSAFKQLNLFPNPADKELTVSFHLQKNSEVSISLYDIQGKYIKTLDTLKPDGTYKRTFNVSDIGSGNYFVRIKAGEAISNQKISIIR